MEVWPIDTQYLFDNKGIKVIKNKQHEYLGPFYIPLSEFKIKLQTYPESKQQIDKQFTIPNVFNDNEIDNQDLYNLQTNMILHQSFLYAREITKQTIGKAFGVCIFCAQKHNCDSHTHVYIHFAFYSVYL